MCIRDSPKNNCLAACHLQGNADAKPRAEIIINVCRPVWQGYRSDYVNLREPKQVELKYKKAAQFGYDPEVNMIFAKMKDKDLIDRSLSTHGSVGFVPTDTYMTLRHALRTRHENEASAPEGGAHIPLYIE